jgi:hypothetical protein
MLHVRIETVCFLIAKAHEFQSQEQVVLGDAPEIPTEDWPSRPWPTTPRTPASTRSRRSWGT